MYVLRTSVLANEEVFQLLGSFSVLKNWDLFCLIFFFFCFAWGWILLQACSGSSSTHKDREAREAKMRYNSKQMDVLPAERKWVQRILFSVLHSSAVHRLLTEPTKVGITSNWQFNFCFALEWPLFLLGWGCVFFLFFFFACLLCSIHFWHKNKLQKLIISKLHQTDNI